MKCCLQKPFFSCIKSFSAFTVCPLPVSKMNVIDKNICSAVQSIISTIKTNNNVKLLAIDFDATLCQIHTYGRWRGSEAALAAHIRPVFVSLLNEISNIDPSQLHVAIVTFSGQSKLIRDVLKLVMRDQSRAASIMIRGAKTKEWKVPIPTDEGTPMDGKQPHIQSVLTEIYNTYGLEISRDEVILIDDDRKNVNFAAHFGYKTVLFPNLPLPSIHMKGKVEAKGVETIYRVQLRYGALLCISKGSVVDFCGYEMGCIVNAANIGGVDGGAVDGAITAAGGKTLKAARERLPVLPKSSLHPIDVNSEYPTCRIPTGGCAMTGPDTFGCLKVGHVLHAVGPNYNRLDDFLIGNQFLESAYRNCMVTSMEHGIELLGFSLLSAGVYRGSQSLEEILRIAVCTVVNNVWDGLREVHLVGHSDEEVACLYNIIRRIEEDVYVHHVADSNCRIGCGFDRQIHRFLNDLANCVNS